MFSPLNSNPVLAAFTQLTGRSSGDSLQASLQALGMSPNMAALQGALSDLGQGNLSGYQRNLFEAFTGVDPGRIQAQMAKPFACGRPSANMGVQLERHNLRGNTLLGDMAAAAGGFALGGAAGGFALGGPLGALAGFGLKQGLSRAKARCIEKRLTRDPMFRAAFEASVGGRFVPDGRKDGKITIARPNFGLPGLNPGIFGALGANPVAGSALSGMARMMGNATNVMGGLNTGFGLTTGASARPGSQMSQLGPGASFEDIVAAFLFDTVKELREEAMAKMRELEQSNQSGRGRGGYGGALGSIAGVAGGAIGGAFGGPVGAGIGQSIGGALGGGGGGGGLNGLQDKVDSRADKMEQLKNIMQRIKEMSQTLSNILNVMHEGSMGTIRNIRA